MKMNFFGVKHNITYSGNSILSKACKSGKICKIKIRNIKLFTCLLIFLLASAGKASWTESTGALDVLGGNQFALVSPSAPGSIVQGNSNILRNNNICHYPLESGSLSFWVASRACKASQTKIIVSIWRAMGALYKETSLTDILQISISTITLAVQ